MKKPDHTGRIQTDLPKAEMPMKDNHTSVTTHDQLHDDLRALGAEIEKILAGSSHEHSGDVVDSLRARLTGAQERLAGFYGDARKKVIHGAKMADETIRANPYQSIAIATGVGLVIGLLVGRRSS